jgi:hypothetical protein
MTAYTKSTNFATKDTLTSGDPLKIVKGTEINTEFDNIQTAVNSKSDTASPTFTGTVTIPTVSVSSTTDSSSVSTGSIITAGGVGVAKALYVGTTANVAGAVTLQSALSVTGVTTVQAGTAAAPAITTTGDTNTGIFFPAADTIAFSEGGAEAMRIDSSGNVGIGTSSPSGNLFSGTTGGTIQLRLGGNSGANYWGIGRDNVTTGDLVFQSQTTERMRISSSGNLLVNSTAAVTNVQEAIAAVCLGSTGPAASFKNSAGATSATLECWNSATSGDNRFITFTTDGYVTRGSITYNRGGGLTAYNTTSDYRAKTVNGAVQNALSKVALLKPSTGRMNDAEQDIDFFVAHELQEIVPSAVTGDKDAVNEDGSPNYQMVDKSALIPLLTAAIQEMKAIIDTQASTITTLTNRITALENK